MSSLKKRRGEGEDKEEEKKEGEDKEEEKEEGAENDSVIYKIEDVPPW